MQSNLTLNKTIYLGFVVFAIFWSCGRSSGYLTFKSLDYPASMSAFLYDQNMNSLVKDENLKTVYSFTIKKTCWALGYGFIPLNSANYITDSLNLIVDKYSGDGIINISVSIEQSIINKVYSFFLYIPAIFPFMPSAADITVTGEVVKVIKTKNITGKERLHLQYISKADIYEKLRDKLNEIH